MNQHFRSWPVSVAMSTLAAMSARAEAPPPFEPTTAVGPMVALTFDLDLGDDEAFERIDPLVPATYFVTGKLAEARPDLVARLAARGTIGSLGYSHAQLLDLPPDLMRADVMLGKRLVEDAVGARVTWFRAPYARFDARLLSIVSELGFRYDSSGADTSWFPKSDLVVLPITAPSGSSQIPTDYQLLVAEGLDEDATLARWIALYEERVARGRPLVLALHPAILDDHRTLLPRLVDALRARGGRFLSSDGVLDALRDRPRTRRATWVALQLGDHDPAVVVADAERCGITDVFVSAWSPEGRSFLASEGHDPFGELARALRRAGVRVHAWIPIGHDSATAVANPDWAMHSWEGIPSKNWISLVHPAARAHILDKVRQLLERYPVDGVHLDYMRFPDTDHDFSPAARVAFEAHRGRPIASWQPRIEGGWRIADERVAWMRWRATVVTDLVSELAVLAKELGGRELRISSALIAESGLSNPSLDDFAQDYVALAPHLDLAVPMAYLNEDRRPLAWVEQVSLGARLKLGSTEMLIGLEGFRDPARPPYTVERFAMALDLAGPGSDGFAIFPYLYFFGRGDEAWNMPARAVAVLAGADTGRDGISLPIVLSGAGVALLALGFGARMRARRRLDRDRALDDVAAATSELELLDPSALEARIAAGEIDGPLVIATARLLGRYDARRVEGFRRSRVLETLVEQPPALMPVEEDGGLPAWEAMSGPYLEEARELGYVVERGERTTLTEAGRELLEASRRGGYKREIWRFIEARLHETLDVTCTRCGAVNEGFWFWTRIDCARCRRAIELQQVARITRVNTTNHPRSYVLT